MGIEQIATILSSAGGVFILQQLWAIVRRARQGHNSWVRREVNKATASQREAERSAKEAREQLALEQSRRLDAEARLDAFRVERDRALEERDDEAREKRIAWELMHKCRLIILELDPSKLPDLNINSTP